MAKVDLGKSILLLCASSLLVVGIGYFFEQKWLWLNIFGLFSLSVLNHFSFFNAVNQVVRKTVSQKTNGLWFWVVFKVLSLAATVYVISQVELKYSLIFIGFFFTHLICLSKIYRPKIY